MGQCRLAVGEELFPGASRFPSPSEEHPRELEIRLKSGYFKGFSVIHKRFSFPSHPLECLGGSFDKARRKKAISIWSTRQQHQRQYRKAEAFPRGWSWRSTTRNGECYYFNGKYWRKIVFMFIVMQKKRFFASSKSVFHSSFFSFPPKLLFIIISPCFFPPLAFVSLCFPLRNGF